MSGAKTMVKKRNMNETTLEEEAIIMDTEVAPEITTWNNENLGYENFLTSVQTLRKNQEIEGYLLKSESKATVDLNDSTKIIEYAMLTSQAFESSTTLSSSFTIGNLETILIEGKNIKTLCINYGQNQLSIFMKKNIDDADILDAILSQTEQ
jgi:predicted regulator of Ras-like GTPase activity (Roadblock/LC7/MglB family)